MPRFVVRRYLCAIALLLAIAPTAHAQLAAPEEQIRTAATAAQRAITTGPVLDIAIGPQGPTNAAFKAFDRPYPLKRRFCTEVTDAQAKSKADYAECLRTPASNLVVRFSRDAASFVGATVKVVELRVVGSRVVTPIVVDTTQKQWTLAELRAAAGSDDRVDVLVVADGSPVGGFALSFADVPQLKPVRTAGNSMAGYDVTVRLDRTGVATSAFLNPRWPVYVGPTHAPGASDAQRQATEAAWAKATLVFDNRSGDRQFVVTFPGIKKDDRWKFLNNQLQLTSCSDDACDAALIIPAHGERKIPVSLLVDAYVENGLAKTVQFDVKLFHDDLQLANPTGYFSLVQYDSLAQDGNGSKWSASVSGSFGSAPDLSGLQAKPDDDPVISDLATRGRANDDTFSGSVRVGLKQSLGSRVKGEFEIRLKNGTFGTSASVTPTKYRLNVAGVQNVTYSAGLFDVAEPSEGIAISESGENIGLHYNWIDVNHILRKYVPRQRHTPLDFKEKEADGDHSATMIQLRGVPGLTWRRAQIDFYAVAGRKHTTRCVRLVDNVCPAKPEGVDDPPPPEVFRLSQWYSTVGAELSVSPKPGWSGTAAIYRSRLNVIEPDQSPYVGADHLKNDTGRGMVGLLTLGWTKYGDAPPGALEVDVPALVTVHGQFAAGTGNSNTDTDDRAYIGETASFAPDSIFLGVLAPAMDTARGEVGAGLTNKTYTGLVVTDPQHSPLGWLARRVFKVPETDIAGETMTFKLHDYRFVHWNDSLSRHAGTEFNASFAVESPSKATYSISLAGFWPGKALTAPIAVPGTDASAPLSQLVRGFQWSAIAKLSVGM